MKRRPRIVVHLQPGNRFAAEHIPVNSQLAQTAALNALDTQHNFIHALYPNNSGIVLAGETGKAPKEQVPVLPGKIGVQPLDICLRQRTVALIS